KQAVHALIEKIFSGRIAAFISDEKTDLTAYGLEKPVCELTFFTQDERTQTLLIGKAPAEKTDTLYAKRVGSDSVFTVPAQWLQEFEINDDLLRSRHVTDLQIERVSSIQLTFGEQQIELSRTNNQWQVIRPVRWDADPALIGQLLKTIGGASVEEFVDSPSAAQAGQIKTAPWTVALLSEGKTNTLRISTADTNGLRLVQYNNEPAFYATAGGIVRDALVDPLFYRSRTVLEINPVQIQKITARNGAIERSVQKTDTGVFASGEPDRQVSAKALTDMMWVLNDLHAKRYVDYNPVSLKPYGLDVPQTTLTVTLSDTNVIGRIVLLGNKTEDGRFAMIQGQNIVFVMSNEAAQTLTCELTVPIEKADEIKQP
ncbi:MAG: DUF4340 domain-containing protein, partial [Verrucomicrobia bacterium]|nr:DUF4340 domain-containing protein [Verrucomicrobiota bacterium]